MEFKIEGLSKTIGKDVILNELDVRLKEGDVLALRGSNGSGKTTLLRIIAGLDKDYQGKVIIENGVTIGYVPQDIILFENLNVRDNLKTFCNGKNAKENMHMLEGFAAQLGLSELFKKKTCKLSGGQKRLVNFLIGLANNPGLILLINSIKKDKIMIITSHQEDFLREVCNISGILINGKMELHYED